MNMWENLKRWRFTADKPEAPSGRRNKPGGLAMIKGLRADFGGEQMNGQIVQTVRVNAHGNWVVEPMPRFIATKSVRFPLDDTTILKGCGATVSALADELLEPIREVGDGEKDETLAWKPVPNQEVV